MKKFSRLISFALAAMMIFALVPFSASAVTLVKEMNIVCFGDSLTANGSPAYPSYLANLTGATVYNAGVGGNTTDMASLRLQNGVIDKNPDVTVICLGMNDQAYSTVAESNMTSLEAYRANLERFVKLLTAEGIDVVFLTPNPVYSAYYTAGGDNYDYGDLPKYCNAMREVAIKYGCGLVDAYYEYSNLSDLGSYIRYGDGVHQSATGRQYFASLVAEYLAAEYENYQRAEMTIVCKDTNGNVLKEYSVVGMEGALITVPSPDLGEGYTAKTADINTSFVNNATHTFTYECSISTAMTNAANANVDDNLKAYISDLTAEANTLLSASELDFEAIGRTSVLLQNALEDVAVLSYGASYTAPDPTYDSYLDLDDDGIRLTDGYKSHVKGWDSRYSAWVSINPEIVIDLGRTVKANVFNGYFSWISAAGVGTPTSMTVSYSTDNINWSTAVASVKSSLGASNNSEGKGTWDRDMFTATLNIPAEMRYVKFNIQPTGSATWVDELEVCYDASKVPDPDDLAVNSTYTTSDLYRQGGSDVDWGWDENVAVTYPDENGASFIDGVLGAASIYDEPWAGFHPKTPEYISTGYHRITFDLGEVKNVGTVDLYVGTSALEFGVTAPASVQVLVSDDGTNFKSVNKVKPSDTANVDGFTTVEKVTIDVNRSARYVELRIVGETWTFVSEVEITAGEVIEHVCSVEGKSWLSDEANHWQECDCYEIINKSAHDDGKWETVIEPEIGVKGKKELRCTVCDYLMDEEVIPALDETPVETGKIGLRGDVTKNGEIDSRDYVFLKRAYFGTYKLDETANLLADVNNSGGLDSRDYVFLKRAYFGTYKIPENIKYVYAE